MLGVCERHVTIAVEGSIASARHQQNMVEVVQDHHNTWQHKLKLETRNTGSWLWMCYQPSSNTTGLVPGRYIGGSSAGLGKAPCIDR